MIQGMLIDPLTKKIVIPGNAVDFMFLTQFPGIGKHQVQILTSAGLANVFQPRPVNAE